MSVKSERSSVPFSIPNDDTGNNHIKQSNGSRVAEMASSYGSSIFRASPTFALTRPTQEEAIALWEIMPTSSLINSPLPEHDTAESRPFALKESFRSKQMCALVSPIGSPPNEPVSLFSIPKIKNGPPYESTLPLEAYGHATGSNVRTKIKAYPLAPRPEAFRFSATDSTSYEDAVTKCIHRGLGCLGILPESILYTIFGYIDYTERHPTLMLVSSGMTYLLTRPEFLLELKHAHKVNGRLLSQAFEEDAAASNELLLVVGGKCPMKANDIDNRVSRGVQIDQDHRRMIMQSNDYKGILGYDLKRAKWLRFGGDPLIPLKSEPDTKESSRFNSHSHRNNLHPLSPMNILNSKPIYLGHPIYSIMFFGGTHYETGQPSNRVIAFSFLTAKWESWPDMMRPRHGDDIILARVDAKRTTSLNDANVLQNDSIVLIGCDLEFCDCYRCNPPAAAVDDDDDVDMTIFVANYLVPDPGRRSHDEMQERADAMGRCEVLDLATRTWARRESKSPSSPPDDGGSAVLHGRYIFLPGTCPPPPSAATVLQRRIDRPDRDATITPLSRSETSSEVNIVHSNKENIHDAMDVEEPYDDVMESSTSDLFRSLHYRPGLVYDSWLDHWSTLPSRPYVTTSSPTTFAYNDRVLVLGGYRSSSENALSCYQHREEDALLDYEDHLDYTWWYTPEDPSSTRSDHNGRWTFGGGSSTMGHRQEFASSSDMAAAVRASVAMLSSCPDSCLGSMNVNDHHHGFPFGAPVNVRGATMLSYQGRMTMLGGLSTFSRTFYDSERKTIWQFYRGEWRRASMTLPVPALLNGYSFSVHV